MRDGLPDIRAMTKRPTRIPGDAPALAAMPEPAADDLPNAVDVDPATITGPVLTKQGWVVPAEKPQKAHG